MNIYETSQLLCEYLLFHYGTPSEVLPWDFGPENALGFAARAVSQTFDPIPPDGRALDIGCSVGRSSFELARYCGEVIGIDFSHRFIEAATALKETGAIDYERIDEGALKTRLTALAPEDVDRTRVQFEVGNAMALRDDLGSFDAVLAANLICRLTDPRRCLDRMSNLVKPGGQLVITTPGTWMDQFTPREHWLGGLERGGIRVTTLDGLHEALDAEFDLQRTLDLPFLIREHSRKFQWSVAQATVWRRK